MALVAHGGPRRITALLRELAHLMGPRVKPVAAQSVAIQEHHYVPRRARFIESAAMRREMNRL
jgi:hypothetical protein